MPGIAWVIGTAVIGLAVVVLVSVAIRIRRQRRIARDETSMRKSRELFHLRREWLEAEFLTLAGRSGRPRGVEWVDCDFQNEVAFARDRHTGQLRALVGVTVSFEAVKGGDMEDNPNVEKAKAATAVFHFDGNQWATDGRAVFNLNPAETIQHFQNELETVD